MSKHDPHGTAASVNGMANAIARVTEWAEHQAARTDGGNVLGLSAEQCNGVGRVVLHLVEGDEPADAIEAQEEYIYDQGGLRQIVDDAEEEEEVDLLRQIADTLDRIEDRLTPKPMRVQL